MHLDILMDLRDLDAEFGLRISDFGGLRFLEQDFHAGAL